jgi:hypothetical protein
VINLSEVWPESEWKLVPMKCIGQTANVLDEKKLLTGDDFFDRINEAGITVYKCTVCGRLHLEVKKHHFDSWVKEVGS